jgi:DNA (cytosine-5)-methyltransferase 1
METVAFCEIEDFPVRVLQKHWPRIPIHRDIRELDGEQYRGTVDVICGGFPCQPFSIAGTQKAQKDNRHLWPEMYRVIQETRPDWVIGENVIGLKDLALDECIFDLEMSGYTVQTFNIPACSVGAHHERQRLWIIANANSHANGKQHKHEATRDELQRNDFELAYTSCINERLCVKESIERQKQEFRKSYIRMRRLWASEPRIHRVANGIPNRMDRIRALGNSVVPQIPELIGLAIMKCDQKA